MINKITAGYGITINGNTQSWPYVSPGSTGAGIVRWNYNMNQFEINDGLTWKPINWSNTQIELDFETQEVIKWAKQKMLEEKEIESLAAKNYSVKIAHENFQKAQEQLKITVLLNKF